MRDNHDGFMIKQELKHQTVWGLALVIMFGAEGSVTANIEVLQLFKVLVANCIIFSTVTRKLVASFSTAKRRRVKYPVRSLI